MEPNGSDLRHAVNGWLADLSAKPTAAQRSRAVKVPSKYLEDEEEDLHEAASQVSRATMGALQKQIRGAGFKGATVHGFGSGNQSGFIVTYQGQEYRFSIDEAAMKMNSALTEADKKVVKAFVAERPGSARLLDTDGVKLDKMGLGAETVAKWVGGRIAIVSTESAKSDQSIIRLIVKEAGPGVVDYSYARKGHRVHGHGAMGRNGHPKLDTFTEDFFNGALWSTNDNSDDSGGEPLDANYSIDDIDEDTIKGLAAECERFQEENADDLASIDSDQGQNGHDFWLTRNRHGVGFWDRGYPKDIATRLTNASHAYGEVDLYVGDDGVIYASGFEPKGAQTPNGKGVYHETAAGKHDMVLHQDHRGSWRIDLVTSASGNHTDVTGPNRGYGSAEEAFQAALDVQRTRGIRGKSHVFIADRDGNLADYEPMEANGTGKGTWAFTETDRVWVPEQQFDRQTLPAGATIEPLRGYGHTMAVMQGGECVGWIVMDENVASDLNDSRELARHVALVAHETTLTPGTSVRTRSGSRSGVIQERDPGGRRVVVRDADGLDWEIETRNLELAGHTENGSVPGAPSSADMRVFRGSETGQIHHTGTPAHTDSWYYEPEDYEGDVLYSMGYATKAQAERQAEIHTMTPISGYATAGHSRNARGAGRLLGLKKLPPGAENSVDCRDATTMVWYLPFLDTPYDVADSYSSTVELCFATLNDGRRFFDQAIKSGDLEKAELRSGKGPRGQLVDEFEHTAESDGYSRNARGAALDEHAATELSLYIENDYALIGAENSKGKSIDANLRKKVAQGKYDSSLAVKLWEYLIEDGARKYAKEFSVGTDWAKIFSPATRRKVAQDFATAWEQENLGGQ